MDIKWHDEHEEKPILHRKDSVLWLSFPLLDRENWLTDAFSTRFGGVSRGCLSSMNLSFAREPSNGNVLKNFRILSDAVGFSSDNIISTHQTHTANVRHVGAADRGSGISKPLPWKNVDGLITDEPDCVLSVFSADCVPLFFADPVRHAIGLSHSGWRGTAGRIGSVTVQAMEKDFGTNPKDLLAVIGPSICMESYEVGEETAQFFDGRFLRKKENGKYLLDLWGANRSVLIEAGIPEENIEMPNLCTACNPDFLFSHRASHGQRGNMGSFLSIRSKY